MALLTVSVTATATATPATASAVVTWGSNDAGQLGTGSTADSSATPVAVTTTGALAGRTVSAVSSGTAHSCAVAGGSAYCWGLNGNGQLGNGVKTDSNVPVAVTNSGALAGKTVTAISAGFAHTCAIAGGNAYCWGSGADGVLGNGATADAAAPVAVGGALAGKVVTSISAGRSDTCAVSAGRAYCWGYNANGQLGNGLTTDSATPVAVNIAGVLAGKTVTAISIGTVSATSACVVADSAAYCWGANTHGAVGDGSTTVRLTPVAVTTTGALGTQAVTNISVGGYSTCAVAAGKAYCWGLNEFGELGNNTVVNQTAPVAVDTTGPLAGKVITAISTGAQITGNAVHPAFGHTCAVASGAPVCWGANQYGQLGVTASMTPTLVPVAVSTADALQARTVTDVSVGAVSSLTLTSPPAVPTTPGAFVSLAPSRVLDTRVNQGATGPVAASGTISLQVLGQGGVPASGVSAVAINVTVAQPAAAGFITVWPSGTTRQQTSNLNFQAGQNIPNLVIVPVGADGKIQLFNGSAGNVHLAADVAGYIVGGTPALPGAFAPLAPSRVLDTRTSVGATGPLAAQGAVSLQVTGKGGIPATGVSAVAVNVTAVTPAAAGFITVWPSGTTRQQTSNLNFQAGQNIPNLVIVPVGTDGKIQLFNGSDANVHLLADVAGYFIAGTPVVPGAFASLAPSRVLDTRVNQGATGSVAASGTISLQVLGQGGVPASGVSAVAINVTVAQPAAAGFITVWPSGTTRQQTSNLNFQAGQNIPNLVIVPVGADGKIQLFNGSDANVQLIADVAGYTLGG